MKEDIKILEELIKEGFSAMCPLEAQAIENLIKGYRELEKKNTDILERLITEKMVNKVMSNNINGYQEALENSIPKSKIKEKIEELNNYDSEFCQRVINHSEHTLTEFVQNILQELIGGK